MRRALCLLSSLAPALLAAVALLPSGRAHAYSFIYTAGCPAGRGAAWKGATSWYLDSAGYSLVGFREVEAATRAGIMAWSDPCCSTFENSYLGTTADTALSNSAKNVLSFIEADWPRELGSRRSTIAVTLTSARGDCSLAFSDMVFNAVGFQFRTSGADTDLRAIATHEFGHWLGLDHTNVSGSTMLPYYQGGTNGRDLGPDDEAGVCALYPGWCERCASDGDCPTAQKCLDGVCIVPPCSKNADCDAGSFCSQGSCVPGCRTHLECAEGESCEQGKCKAPTSSCTICGSCTRDSDCGMSRSYACIDLYGTGTGVCTKFCSGGADCDGDSACYELSAGTSTYQLCFAPDLGGGDDLCPQDYSCQLDDTPAALTCPGLWNPCAVGLEGCGGRSDYCISTGANAKCSCTCRTDEECGDDARCLPDPVTGVTACYPDTLVDACGSTFCPPGTGCRNDRCIPACNGFLCEAGEVCTDGECVSVCGACAVGFHCDTPSATCVPDDCAGVACGAGFRCFEGACVKSGSCGGPCPDGSSCHDGACVPDHRSDPDGGKKDDGCSGCAAGDSGLSLLGALALGATALRRRPGRRVAA